MRRLGLILVLLLTLAGLLTAAGILLSRGDGWRLDGTTVLSWRLDGDLAEQAPAHGWYLPGMRPPTSIATVYSALAGARRDGSLRGIAVSIGTPRFGLAKAQEVHQLLTSLHHSGKFVRCYLETAGEGSNGTLTYYLATACDRIALAPAGEINLLGLYADSTFLRGTLEKLKIDPAFGHIGKYKSAGETFTEYGHSPAAREAMDAVLDRDFADITGAIAAARKLTPTRVRELIDQAPFTAEDAQRAGLVDDLQYADEFRTEIEKLAGGEPRIAALEAYAPRSSYGAPRVAVVFAAGTIVRGRGGSNPWTDESFLGSRDMERTLDKLGEDKGLSAIVLRVDSPGGSALASDLILRSVERLAARKPLIVSMADVAASGGYYISAKARRIVAEPATLTGSIGVVGGKLVVRRFQQDLLGITHDPLTRGANAGIYSALEPFTPEQQERFLAQMEHTYRTFVGHVAAGRKMSPEAVDAVAGGRVWTGADARERGLVDELGGLDAALALARSEAGIAPGTQLALEFHPEPASFFEMLAGRRGVALPAALKLAIDGLEEPSIKLLLPPELGRLARPF